MTAEEIAARLDDFDRRVLRTCCGEDGLISGWGAAVGVALGVLVSNGLAGPTGGATDLGRSVAALLRAREGAQP